MLRVDTVVTCAQGYRTVRTLIGFGSVLHQIEARWRSDQHLHKFKHEEQY